jgi:hypothetical protein
MTGFSIQSRIVAVFYRLDLTLQEDLQSRPFLQLALKRISAKASLFSRLVSRQHLPRTSL